MTPIAVRLLQLSLLLLLFLLLLFYYHFLYNINGYVNAHINTIDFSPSLTLSRVAIFEIGTPITGSPCSFTITPQKNKSDIFISPTYPGTYPKDLFCTYHFIGESNQRVRLEFRDFDLFFGGPQ